MTYQTRPDHRKKNMAASEHQTGFLAGLSPWGSRTASPRRPDQRQGAMESTTVDDCRNEGTNALDVSFMSDHTVDSRHFVHQNRYPHDCPPLKVRWYHAIDVPKRKPFAQNVPEKEHSKPRKWIPFSASDSQAIEAAFQSSDRGCSVTVVPVNEDYLFDVNVEARELAPAYWMGPVYHVKRGTWFTPDGEPLNESLAMQLEESYLRIKPWQQKESLERMPPSIPQDQSPPIDLTTIIDGHGTVVAAVQPNASRPSTKDAQQDNIQDEVDSPSKIIDENSSTTSSSRSSSQTCRLFGAYMNSTVTFETDSTAWHLTDDMWTRMGSTLYQKFAGGAHYAGVKYIRGYREPKDEKRSPPLGKETLSGGAERVFTSVASQNPYDVTTSATHKHTGSSKSDHANDRIEDLPSQARRQNLERQVSSLMTSFHPGSQDRQEAEQRQREEDEIREGYKTLGQAEQAREIDHLLLVTHGIGQRLGMRSESINFIHDVNSMRKSFKAVYNASSDLQSLNSEAERDDKNNRIQVIPIVWRHLLDFPQQSLRHNREEHDISDVEHEDFEYPNLQDITVEGVPLLRNFLTDLALDILLYQSPTYKGHISRIVVQELNRIYHLFMRRNPSFKGRVSLVGHSLGSAIMFDILCAQKDTTMNIDTAPANKGRRTIGEDLRLDFKVQHMYALGSPIGIFQMLKGRTISARPTTSFVPAETPASPLDDPFAPDAASNINTSDITTSSPLCEQLFNIFHPTDPISYRIEPLISPAMSNLKAQPLPYTKKGIFGTPASQGLTGVGARVSQGVTNLWTSIGSNIASGLLSRNFGLHGTDIADQNDKNSVKNASLHPEPHQEPLETTSNDPGSNGPPHEYAERAPCTARQCTNLPQTLIESEIETLYAGFMKDRLGENERDEGLNNIIKEHQWRELEEHSRRLRKEEAKVRALNANGRVDYSIQEGAFDISLLASIASHLTYWADEDVSHFIISQLLASC